MNIALMLNINVQTSDKILKLNNKVLKSRKKHVFYIPPEKKTDWDDLEEIMRDTV